MTTVEDMMRQMAAQIQELQTSVASELTSIKGQFQTSVQHLTHRIEGRKRQPRRPSKPRRLRGVRAGRRRSQNQAHLRALPSSREGWKAKLHLLDLHLNDLCHLLPTRRLNSCDVEMEVVLVKEVKVPSRAPLPTRPSATPG